MFSSHMTIFSVRGYNLYRPKLILSSYKTYYSVSGGEFNVFGHLKMRKYRWKAKISFALYIVPYLNEVDLIK